MDSMSDLYATAAVDVTAENIASSEPQKTDTEGKMPYQRDFLLQLRYSTDSMKKPDNLQHFPEIISDELVCKPSGPVNYTDLPTYTPGFFRGLREPVFKTPEERKVPVLKYKYNPDQWSPLNPEGKMQYDRDFLLQLQYSKDPLKKPDTLPQFPEIIPDKPLSKPSMDMRSGPGNYRDLPDFTPGYLRPSIRLPASIPEEEQVNHPRGEKPSYVTSNVDRDHNPHVTSTERHTGDGEGDKSNTETVHREQNSLAASPLPWCDLDPDRVVQVLSRLKNPGGGNVEILMAIPALKSTVGEAEKEKDNLVKGMVKEEGIKTCNEKEENKEQKDEMTKKIVTVSKDEQELYRKVRSILNKLTPQKFQTLIKQIQGLVIDTETKLKGLASLIVEQATTDTAYAKEYASLCAQLLQVEVPLEAKKGECLRFRMVLLLICRKRFTEIINCAKNVAEVTETEKWQDTIKHRRTCVSIARFMGELFLHEILLEKIILDCLSKLLQPQDEILLECFCHLMIIVGETLDKRNKLDDYFQQITGILHGKIVSARCGFILQDMIDLRDNNWKPVRYLNTPMTIDQICREVEQEVERQESFGAAQAPVLTQSVVIGPPQPKIPFSTASTGRLGKRGCRIYKTPSDLLRGTPYLELGEPEEDLYRKVRSILNKLTPQKFQTLIKQVQGLVIDTETRLKDVTDIIFEKAIGEPAFSVAYANMCRYLLTLKVPSDTKQGESVNFRVILLTRCQRQFEKVKDTQLDIDRGKKDIEKAKDPKTFAEMKEDLNQAATNARERSIGNIRFMGELFKLKMLTETVMHDCVFKLLRSRDEENLECLCRFLTTIGKELDSEKAKPRMDQYFQQMKKIVAEKKASSRCRFMLQDVIDLRHSNWKPRRDDNTPKTIDQIHKEAKREAVEQNMLTALHMSRQPSQFKQNADIQLGPARSFGGWGRGRGGLGSSRASQEGEKPKTPGSRFSALIKEDDQRSRAFGRDVSPERGEGDRMRGNQPGGGFQRGKVIPRSSQEQERDRALASARSLVSGRTTPPSGTTSREGSRNRGGATHDMERPPAPVRELSEEEMEKKTQSIIDEFLHIQDRKEAIQSVQELNSPKTTHFFVYFAINHVLERSKQARQQTGHLLHDLINQKVISVDTYLQGLTEILQAVEDMEIDIPKIWLYLGELIGPMIQDGSVPLSFLTKACEPLKASGKAGNLMAEVLHDASQRLGHTIVAHLWRNNMMDWTDFVSQEKLQQFLKDKNLDFTVGPDSAPSTPTSKVPIEWIIQNLTELLNNPKCDHEKTFDWIEENIPAEITKENTFIRALMTAVCTSAVSGSGNTARVDPEVVKKWRALLIKYLDHSAVFELQALYALQALVNSLEHPSRVLRSFFDTLYDEEIISEDAFNQWETSKEEQEGKGVALRQVVQFFAWLREGEEEEH